MFLVADAGSGRVLARKRTREAAQRVARRFAGLGRAVEIREVLSAASREPPEDEGEG